MQWLEMGRLKPPVLGEAAELSAPWCSASWRVFWLIWDKIDLKLDFFLSLFLNVNLESSSKAEADGSEMLWLLSCALKGLKQVFFRSRKLIWHEIFSQRWS